MRKLPLICLLATLGFTLPAIADGHRRSDASCKPKGGKKDDAPPAEKKKKKHEKEPPEETAADERPPPPATPGAVKGPTDDEGKALQRGERVEFDARLIQGQTAKAGAVYLFARVPTNLKSMVRERTSFREKIVRTVYPIEEDAP